MERALELSRAVAAMPHTEQDIALAELKTLFEQITEAANDTADCIVASAGYAR